MPSRWLFAALVLSACHDRSERAIETARSCGHNTRAEIYADGLERRGVAGHFSFKLVSAAPAPPARGDNTWVIDIRGASGEVISDAEVRAIPFMPDHGHGTPMKVVITATPTAGRYQLAPVNLWMPGYWETTVSATRAGISDTALFKFCIPN